MISQLYSVLKSAFKNIKLKYAYNANDNFLHTCVKLLGKSELRLPVQSDLYP